MIIQQFPDLQWLRRQIDQRFSNRRGINNLALDTDGFPSVVINSKASDIHRADIIGPISIFANKKGHSIVKTDNRTVTVDEDCYFISNRFQSYTLGIEQEQTETFNIHIGEYFSEQLLASAMQDSDKLLNNGKQLSVPTVAFHNQLYRRDDSFNQLIRRLQTAEANDKLFFEETLADILTHLLVQHRGLLSVIAKMPPVKASTRIELYRRLSLAMDHIHSSYLDHIELGDMAAAACLSKFHFLRLFRHVYHVSPYQYLQRLRMEKSKEWLRDESMSVLDIAAGLGFENSNSFSRLFFRRNGVYPSQYRAMTN